MNKDTLQRIDLRFKELAVKEALNTATASEVAKLERYQNLRRSAYGVAIEDTNEITLRGKYWMKRMKMFNRLNNGEMANEVRMRLMTRWLTATVNRNGNAKGA